MAADQENQIDDDVLSQTIDEVDGAVEFLRLYHYLSHLNYLKPLEFTKYGSVVLPYRTLKSVAYGFARNDSIFCIQFNGVLYDFFNALTPIDSMFLDDSYHRGISVMMKPVKFGDYVFPPLNLFFPIFSQRVYDKAFQNAEAVAFSKIEPSFIADGKFKVTRVADDFAKISTTRDYAQLERDNQLMADVFK